MATFTPNLNLEQPSGGERTSLVVLNTNFGKIDEFAGKAKGTVITNEYSTVLSAINALRTSKTFPFTIQKAGSSSFSDLPSGVSSTCEWTVVCSGSSERVTAILTIYTGGSSMNGWSWTANIYNGSYILDWTSLNAQFVNSYGELATGITYQKYGKIVIIYFNGNTVAASSGWTNLLTVPDNIGQTRYTVHAKTMSGQDARISGNTIGYRGSAGDMFGVLVYIAS